MLGNSWAAAQVAASQGLNYTELVIWCAADEYLLLSSMFVHSFSMSIREEDSILGELTALRSTC